MKTIHRGVGLGAVLVMLSLLASCGGELTAPKSGGEAAPAQGIPGTPTTAAPQEEAEAEPATLADAEALLEKARFNLDRLALNEPALAPAPAAAGASAPSVSRAESTPSAARAEGRRADKSSSADDAKPPPAPAKEVNTCETACKAFSSLTRASDAVCRLDTDGGKRCERARQIREDASHRVASCGCAK